MISSKKIYQFENQVMNLKDEWPVQYFWRYVLTQDKTYSSFDIWCDWETVSFEVMFWEAIQILWCSIMWWCGCYLQFLWYLMWLGDSVFWMYVLTNHTNPLMLAVILEKKNINGTFIETVNGHYQPCINGIKSFVVSSYFRKKPIMELS